jgi:lipid-A-disaccharide synthase
MEIFFSAGEASSDKHGAYLLSELKKKDSNLVAFGLGGEALRNEGLELLMHAKEFSVLGGPFEVLGALKKRKELEKKVESRLYQKRPDLAILIDSGEINLRLASLFHFFKVPVVYFIPPKVWVWRHSRIEKIKQHVRLVLSILPFEKEIYEEWEIPFVYVGNPLIDECPISLDRKKACEILGLDSEKKYISVFLGSRHSEVKYHVDLFSKSLIEFSKFFKNEQNLDSSIPELLLPLVPNINIDQVLNEFQNRLASTSFKIHSFIGKSHECLVASHAALVKSGTSTLEAALLGCPMVLSYRSSKFSEFLYKTIVRYKGFVGLVNLFLVEPSYKALGFYEKNEKKLNPIVSEMILDKARPDLIAKELLDVYQDTDKRKKMLLEFQRLKNILAPHDSPVKMAALEIQKLLHLPREQQHRPIEPEVF